MPVTVSNRSFPAPQPRASLEVDSSESASGLSDRLHVVLTTDFIRRSAALVTFSLAVVLVMLAAGGAQAQNDTDNDGLSDADEIAIHGTDPTVGDTDLDGLPDGVEVTLGTSPLNADTDGDGVSDAEEYLGGGDPLAADSTPGRPVVTQIPTTVGPVAEIDELVETDVVVTPEVSDAPETLAFDDGTGGRSPLFPLYILAAVAIGAGMFYLVSRTPQIHSDRPY